MAAEFTYNPIQEVAPNQSVLLNTTIGCNKGYVYHRPESGIVTLRGIVNNPCARFARYQVTFNGNIAVPADGTAGEIQLGIAISGEVVPTSLAKVTPTAVNAYNNVTSTAIIDVPSGCCADISVDNFTTVVAPATVAQSINVQNANLVVDRIA